MNLEELRKALSEQVTSLRAGTVDPKAANALCNTAGKWISTVRLQLEYAKMMGLKPDMKVITDKSRRQK